MKRLLFHFVGVSAAIVCIASAVMWPVSHWRGHQVGSIVNPVGLTFVSVDGIVLVVGYGNPDGKTDLLRSWEMRADAAELVRLNCDRYFQGFGYAYQFGGLATAKILFTTPYWFWLCLSAGFFAWYLRRWRKRAAEGCCGKCGYDLRGSAASPVCPECGAGIVNLTEPSEREAY